MTGQIEVRPGGAQPTWVLTSQGRVPSGSCSVRHERRHALQMQKQREILAGGKEETSQPQAAEVRALAPATPHRLSPLPRQSVYW